ncbi:hypothetical protein GPM19_01660 [Halomonas sp. ZH2S]|uniref:Tetratricopeptide repeat protein n=1 Tax=Vreelandella zhuhanensis TaxID=2684210 RepID=A0A7X3GXX8_9GAMM|nr:TRAP transporter TatT component family protein [Halomonas zhuhanensis]MWJ26928.1 hypothetical protein [Halomonas zhuhanensis]
MKHYRSLRRCVLTSSLLVGLVLTPLSVAMAYENALFSLKNRWENSTTQLAETQRREALKALADEMEVLAEQHPDEADVLIWQGIVLASYAREQSGLGALGSAGDARDVLERALELDPEGGNGSAYVTLGALYDRAPGWPLGFGDDETAESMFQRALEIRPDGIDVNYYYATYLEEAGELQAARRHAERAANGNARDSRQASDEALRQQAQTLQRRL